VRDRRSLAIVRAVSRRRRRGRGRRDQDKDEVAGESTLDAVDADTDSEDEGSSSDDVDEEASDAGDDETPDADETPESEAPAAASPPAAAAQEDDTEASTAPGADDALPLAAGAADDELATVDISSFQPPDPPAVREEDVKTDSLAAALPPPRAAPVAPSRRAASTPTPAPRRPREDSLPPFDETTEFTGELLKRVRESRGIQLRRISDTTRIPAPSLAAVEEEAFADLPNARVYVRGFVRCLAQEIGLDPDLVAKSYLRRWQAWFEAQRVKQRGYFR
jgi:hypothetical protein